MSLVVFLRGVNVGGHRTFRPSLLAKELSDYDVVNVGAAGNFVVRKPGSKAKFRAELLKRLPFEAEMFLCDGRDLISLVDENPFAPEPKPPDITRFVTVLAAGGKAQPFPPVTLPPKGKWLVRTFASKGCFVFGEYRRDMKTIGYLSQLDKMVGARGTTRNWNTIMTIVGILKVSNPAGK